MLTSFHTKLVWTKGTSILYLNILAQNSLLYVYLSVCPKHVCKYTQTCIHTILDVIWKLGIWAIPKFWFFFYCVPNTVTQSHPVNLLTKCMKCVQIFHYVVCGWLKGSYTHNEVILLFLSSEINFTSNSTRRHWRILN